jgi:hypothetical protein
MRESEKVRGARGKNLRWLGKKAGTKSAGACLVSVETGKASNAWIRAVILPDSTTSNNIVKPTEVMRGLQHLPSSFSPSSAMVTSSSPFSGGATWALASYLRGVYLWARLLLMKMMKRHI